MIYNINKFSFINQRYLLTFSYFHELIAFEKSNYYNSDPFLDIINSTFKCSLLNKLRCLVNITPT